MPLIESKLSALDRRGFFASVFGFAFVPATLSTASAFRETKPPRRVHRNGLYVQVVKDVYTGGRRIIARYIDLNGNGENRSDEWAICYAVSMELAYRLGPKHYRELLLDLRALATDVVLSRLPRYFVPEFGTALTEEIPDAIKAKYARIRI